MRYTGPIEAVDEVPSSQQWGLEIKLEKDVVGRLEAELAATKKELKEADKRLERAYRQDQLLILTLKELADTKEQLSRVLEE